MVEIKFPSKERMCERKVSFRTKQNAEKYATKYGQRVYNCPFCFCWHCTSRENWQDEYIDAKSAREILDMLVDHYDKKLLALKLEINTMRHQIGNLKDENKKLKGKAEG